jgi:hypothetical protein
MVGIQTTIFPRLLTACNIFNDHPRSFFVDPQTQPGHLEEIGGPDRASFQDK